jgi:hypothetical protein
MRRSLLVQEQRPGSLELIEVDRVAPRRRIPWIGLMVGVCIALAAAAWVAAPWYVYAKILPEVMARYGLTIEFDRRALSIAGGAQLHDVRFLDGDEVVLAAKRMNVRISLRALYGGRTIVERLVFDDPVLHSRIDANGYTNIGRILERPKKRPGAPQRPATWWREVVIRGGTVEFHDRVRGVRLRITDIESEVLDLQTGDGESQDRFGQITLDADLEQPDHEPAPLSIVHWTTSTTTAKPTFIAHAALTGIDLDAFPVYVDAKYRASYGVDHLDLVVSLDVRDGVIRRGAAVATSPERKRPLTLLFGGPFDDPILDRSGQLTALWELPFARLGRLGDVTVETGNAVVAGAVGVVKELSRGDPFAAGGAAVDGVEGGVSALGSNALDAVEDVGRALGLVEPEKPRDVAAVHAHQRDLFLAARRTAAQGFSRAQSDPSP